MGSDQGELILFQSESGRTTLKLRLRDETVDSGGRSGGHSIIPPVNDFIL